MIDTVRLRLRRPRRGDVDAVFAYRSRAEVARHLRAGPWSREKTERELTRYATAAFGTFGDELVLLAETRDGGAVVGEVGLRWPDATGAAEVGYVFNPEFGGQGFATEAVRGVVSAAFERWAVAQVIAITDAANRDSRRLCERIGMHLAASPSVPTGAASTSARTCCRGTGTTKRSGPAEPAAVSSSRPPDPAGRAARCGGASCCPVSGCRRCGRPEPHSATGSYPRRRSAVSIRTSTRAVIPVTSTGRRPAT